MNDITIVHWAIVFGFMDGNFFLIPTIRFHWCSDDTCSCGRALFGMYFGNMRFEIRKEVLGWDHEPESKDGN